MIAGTEKKSALLMAGGVALHIVTWLGREIPAVRWGLGIVAGLVVAYGCAEHLGGKGYPKLLGLPALALSVVWVWVCIMVPDREYRELPPPQREPSEAS